MPKSRSMGFVNHAMYRILMDAAIHNEGSFIEFGICDGKTFDCLYENRDRLGQHHVIAVDTFTGMPESDIEYERNAYPPGTFDVGGSAWFRKKYPCAVVHEGIIPEVLKDINVGKGIAFAHIDIDFEVSTLETLRWVWDKIVDDGIIVCHDYLPGNNTLATKGIKDWMKESGIMPAMMCDTSVVFRKGDSIQSILDKMPDWQRDMIRKNYIRD